MIAPRMPRFLYWTCHLALVERECRRWITVRVFLSFLCQEVADA